MHLQIRRVMGLRLLAVCVCVCVCVCKCVCASETLRPIERKIKSLLIEVQKNTSTNLTTYTTAHYLKWSVLSACSW